MVFLQKNLGRQNYHQKKKKTLMMPTYSSTIVLNDSDDA